MKDIFKEYNPLSKEEIKELWNKAIFVFDTNVLLNLYRYSEDTTSKFIERIEELKERVWLPYQVGFEFNKNRLTVISDQKKSYKEFETKINQIIDEVENKNRNPFLSENVLSKLIAIKEEIKKEIDIKTSHYENSIWNDYLLHKINDIFYGKVEQSPNHEELKKIFNEGEKRYKDKIPPGYKDSNKSENEKYGDLVIWKQIINKSKNEKIDIIFILDDRKEDWWLEHQGKIISPRPELLKEFRSETSKSCHFYEPFRFLEYSNEYFNSNISNKVIEEVKNYKIDIEPTNNNQYVIIDLILKGNQNDIAIFITDIKAAGYNIFLESNYNDLHNITFILPNIPDLERRLNDKYLSILDKYNVQVIKIIKK